MQHVGGHGDVEPVSPRRLEVRAVVGDDRLDRLHPALDGVGQLDLHLREGAEVDDVADRPGDAGRLPHAGRSEADPFGPHHHVARASVEAVGLQRAQQVPATDVDAPTAEVLAPQEVRHPQEARHERRGRTLVDVTRSGALLDPTVVHHRDPVAHRERLLLVVGDVHEGDAHLAVQRGQLALERLAQLGVERAERFVEQQHPRLQDERAGEGDPLLLAARQLVGPALRQGGELHELERRPDAGPTGGLVPVAEAEPERHVVPHRHVGEQRVALEDGVDRALLGRHVGDVATVDPDLARRRALEPTDHPQGGRLAAARRTQQRVELARGDLDVDAIDRDRVIELLHQPHELDAAAAVVGEVDGVARRLAGHASEIVLADWPVRKGYASQRWQ